jgi:UDP-glucose 4-epimerase
MANCSTDKAKRLLGSQAKGKLEEGLLAMIDWIKQQGPRPFERHLNLEIDQPSASITWSQKLL